MRSTMAPRSISTGFRRGSVEAPRDADSRLASVDDSSSSGNPLGGGAALTKPEKPLTAFSIDWETIDRRRRADLQKLDAMQQYAYTKGCRRGFRASLLRRPRGALVLRGLRQLPRHTRRRREGRSAGGARRARHAKATTAWFTRRTASRRRRIARAHRRRRSAPGSAARSPPNHFPRGAGSGLRRVSRSHPRRNGRSTPDERAARLARFVASVRQSSRSTAIAFSPSFVPSTRRKRLKTRYQALALD